MTEFDLTTNAQGQLVLSRPGEDDVTDVRLRRAFPLTHGSRMVSVRSAEGRELILIDDLADVPAAVRRTIESALAGSTFVPRITKVDSVDVRFGHQQWAVQTDRGPAAFRVQEREDIRFLDDGRFRLKDVDGTVYELDALDDLDPASRRAVEPLM